MKPSFEKENKECALSAYGSWADREDITDNWLDENRTGWLVGIDCGFDLTLENNLQHLKSLGLLIPDWKSLTSYLLKNTVLIDLVNKICPAAIQSFAPPHQLSLEVYKDPETGHQSLTIYIREAEYSLDILDLIDQFRENFHIELDSCASSLFITTDFQPPLTNN